MAPKIVCVVGPTACGKTTLGVLLAKKFNGEVVSADSMQIYRGMTVGTAAPTPEEMDGVPHHMVAVADPAEQWSAARYAQAATPIIDDILARGKLPILVGGTGLYIDSLVSGRDFAAVDGDQGLREALSAEYDALGGEAMHRRLQEIDPERAAILHPGDKRRIVRALEVYRLTGMTITEHDRQTRALPRRFDAAAIHLNFKNRAALYARIDRRVDMMVEQGLFREVEGLLAAGLSPESTAMQAIGYKEAVRSLQGELRREEAVDLIKQASRRYAKRQLTWFNRDKEALPILWEDEPDFEYARRLSTEFLHSRGLS